MDYRLLAVRIIQTAFDDIESPKPSLSLTARQFFLYGDLFDICCQILDLDKERIRDEAKKRF